MISTRYAYHKARKGRQFYERKQYKCLIIPENMKIFNIFLLYLRFGFRVATVNVPLHAHWYVQLAGCGMFE